MATTDNTAKGIFLNTLLGLPSAAKKVGKSIAKFSGETLKGAARAGLDIAEAPSRVGSKVGADLSGVPNPIKPYQPIQLPGRAGGLESFTNQAQREINEGVSPLRAASKGVFDFATNEPTGVALKPLGLAVGSIGRTPIGKKIAKGVGEFARDTIGKFAPAFKNMHEDDLSELVDFTQTVHGGGQANVDNAIAVRRLAERHGINPNQSDQSLATQLSKKMQSTPETQYALKNSDTAALDAFDEQPFQTVKKKPPEEFNPQSYVKEQVAKREAAKQSASPGIVGSAKSFLANAKAKLVDFSAPIEDVLNESVRKNKITLKPSQDIHNQIDRVLRAPTLAGQFAKDNGLEKIIQGVDNIDEFDQYLTARHGIDLDTQGINTGRELVKDEALVKALSPKYEQQAKVVSDYSRKLLDYSVQSGLISKELAGELAKKYPNYVPFNRVFNELEKSGGNFGGTGVASIGSQSVVQKILGSSREVESPIESLLSKTHDAFKQGEKNQAAKILASYEKLPGNPFNLKELPNGETAAHTISFLDDGVKKTFETTKAVAEAAKSLNVQQLNILGKMFALPTRLARIGITGINLPFIGANIARDQVSAFINSNHGLRTSIANPVNFGKALFAALKHNDLYDEAVRAGAMGTSFDLSRDQVGKTVKEIRAGRSTSSKALYTVTHPGQILKAVEDLVGRAEELGRLQQYGGSKDALLAQGMSPEEATIGAARQAREATVNFARRGEWGTVLNSAFLYLNASIQGTRTLMRNLKTKPLATASKIAIAGMFPVASVTAWNLKDPERKAAYEDIADYEKENNIIIVPPNPTKDENGKWNVIKIPLSQEINSLLGAVRKPIESAYGLDPVKFGDFADALLGTVSPIEPNKRSVLSTLTPQALKPAIEGTVNQNLFTGFPQIPRKLEGLSPENQVRPNTSGTARKIAGPLGISPIKVEEFVKGTLGGVGSQFTNAADTVASKLGLIPKDQIGGQSIPAGITARFNQARGGQVEEKEADKVGELLQTQNDERFKLATKAEDLVSKLDSLATKEEKVALLNEATRGDKILTDKVKDVLKDKKAGLTYLDRQVKQLGVENGERAKYIVSHVKQLKTKEEKVAYLNELSQKGIITKNVKPQVKALLKQ